MPRDPRQHDLLTADPHRTVDAPCDEAALDRAIRALSGDTNTVVLAQALGSGVPYVRSGHFAILGSSRDTLGHFATLSDALSTEDAKQAARIALARTHYANRQPGISLTERDYANARTRHAAWNNRSHGLLVGRLECHAFVRAVRWPERGAGFDEPAFILAGAHNGVPLLLKTIATIAQHHAQDSIIYAGPETSGVTKLIELRYQDAPCRLDSGAPLLGQFSDPATAASPLT